MPVCLLANQCFISDINDDIKAIIYEIVPQSNDQKVLFKIVKANDI